jgi:hypothetical protein
MAVRDSEHVVWDIKPKQKGKLPLSKEKAARSTLHAWRSTATETAIWHFIDEPLPFLATGTATICHACDAATSYTAHQSRPLYQLASLFAFVVLFQSH